MKKIGRTFFLATLLGTALSGRAQALCATDSFVRTTVTQIDATSWLYSFAVQNGCRPNHQQLMTDFYLPYFADAGITNIVVPDPDVTSTTSTIAWTAAIEPNNDLFGLENAGVIDFHVTVTPELEVEPNVFAPGVGYYGTTGFSFTANFAGVEGPDAILQIPFDNGAYTGTTLLFGDPAIPGSPLTIAALAVTATPEPGTMTLMAIGLFFLATPVLKRRRSA
jgi:PEP-CTERM motif